MVLQINTYEFAKRSKSAIKPSRRRILPNLNVSKSRQSEIVGNRGRKRMTNAQLARKMASQTTRRQIQRDLYGRQAGDPRRGQSLKSGIMSMAKRADGVTDEMLSKLNKMDPAKLDQMYQGNKLIFDVYFQYEGVSVFGAGIIGDKTTDVNFLIRQYELYNGPIQ